MPRFVRGGKTLVFVALAVFVVVAGTAVALRASATTSLGRDVVDVVTWEALPDSVVVAVLSDVHGARDRSEVVVLDASTGVEVGRLVTGPSPHVAVDRANERIHLAFESLAPSGQVTGVGVSLDERSGRVVSAATVPAPWGTPFGLTQPGLFASPDGGFLVYAHFVRQMDPRGEQVRNETAFSILDPTRLTVVDTLQLDRCGNGQVSGPPDAGIVTLRCSDSDDPGSVATLEASARGFDRSTLVRAPTSEALQAPLVATRGEDASDVTQALANVGRAARNKPEDAAGPLYHAATTTADSYYVSRRAPTTSTIAGGGLYRIDRASGALTAAAVDLPLLRSLTATAQGVLVVAPADSRALTTFDAATLTPLQRWTLDTGGTPVEYVTAG